MRLKEIMFCISMVALVCALLGTFFMGSNMYGAASISWMSSCICLFINSIDFESFLK